MAAAICKLMGVIFIIVAISGFITGHEGWIFHINMAHNLVHLLSGLLALACSFSGKRPAGRRKRPWHVAPPNGTNATPHRLNCGS